MSEEHHHDDEHRPGALAAADHINTTPYFLHATPSGGLHSSLDGNTGRLQLLTMNTWRRYYWSARGYWLWEGYYNG